MVILEFLKKQSHRYFRGQVHSIQYNVKINIIGSLILKPSCGEIVKKQTDQLTLVFYSTISIEYSMWIRLDGLDSFQMVKMDRWLGGCAETLHPTLLTAWKNSSSLPITACKASGDPTPNHLPLKFLELEL